GVATITIDEVVAAVQAVLQSQPSSAAIGEPARSASPVAGESMRPGSSAGLAHMKGVESVDDPAAARTSI
ncbi:MAG: hypothetical protein JWQ11_2746, partial [Rhizobacter sp.]|nr:hypothetical protein [Rhizobacter sp.]